MGGGGSYERGTPVHHGQLFYKSVLEDRESARRATGEGDAHPTHSSKCVRTRPSETRQGKECKYCTACTLILTNVFRD